MESMLKFLVVLVVIAGILWVVSPLVYGAVSGGIQRAPELKISGYTYDVTPLPDSECVTNMCEIMVSGTLYNFGGPAKNILITVFFNNQKNENIGSVNMPLISSLGEEQAKEFSFKTNFTCQTKTANAAMIHSERA